MQEVISRSTRASDLEDSIKSMLNPAELEDFKLGSGEEIIEKVAPRLKWEDDEPLHLRLKFLCRLRPNVSRFFFDMISRWLLPTKKIYISQFWAINFRCFEDSDKIFTFCEMDLHVQNEDDLFLAKKNLIPIEAEIFLGSSSFYHAARILERRGLSLDEKNCMIQEKVAYLINSRPRDFDYDIFEQMQQFLLAKKQIFRAIRESGHIIRIISMFYLFRRDLLSKTQEFPGERHLSFKLTKVRLNLPLGIKRVLGVFVGVNFLRENEVFDQRHLLAAFQNCIPDIVAVEKSFIMDESSEDKIRLIYLEVEKTNGEDFSIAEVKLLRKKMPEDLKGCVERLIRPVFMPRNEEEVMRNMIALSQELKYVKDIAHAIITFDEHTDAELWFTVIVGRIWRLGTKPLKEIVLSKSKINFTLDRIRTMGKVSGKHPKEVAVFRVKLSSLDFLRRDRSVNLYKARQEIFEKLQGLVGEIRDFNGGMISKQMEVFQNLKKTIGNQGQREELLLENFFHSIFPVEMRGVLDVSDLSKFFKMLVHLASKKLDNETKFECCFEENEGKSFIMMSMKDFYLRQRVSTAVSQMLSVSFELISVHLQAFDNVYLGYIYFCDDRGKKDLFFSKIEQVLENEKE